MHAQCKAPFYWRGRRAIQIGARGCLTLQTIGFSDSDTAALSVFFSLGYAVGIVTGGFFGDTVAKRFSHYGRPFVNQVSIAVTAPLVAVYFKGLPGLPSHLSNTLTSAGRARPCIVASTVLSIP